MEIDIKANEIEIITGQGAHFQMNFEDMKELEQAIKMIREITEKKTYKLLHIKT